MPHVQLNDVLRLNLLRLLQRNSFIPMYFRQWEMIEYPLLQENDKTVWAVKSTNNLEKPRYIVLAFQTNRKGNKKASAVQFDNCKISNLKLFLNAELYPYESSNVVWEESLFRIEPRRIFIDFQGFELENDVVMKEIAILNDEGKLAHFTLLPPHPFENLKQCSMRKVLEMNLLSNRMEIDKFGGTLESSAGLEIPLIKATQRELEHKILVVRDSVSSVKEELMSRIRSNTEEDVRDFIELHDKILDLTKRVRFVEEDLKKLQPVKKKTKQSDTATSAT
ncbi:hypothetical protein QAD02_006981 [Eretmocerus hayati]|uniref:Uncharacterized protein n=1 Tax=Eretmocerus hayati TaxID=131215 RepID=A0ACC2N2D5_9HYME|nr:hypothetical protein QAD02_006981 [Eretmocerus hayati]